MTTPDLGLLQRVDLRTAWENEAGKFTPWLAQEKNLKLLSDTIGMSLELEAQEKNVGPFRADILCRDATQDHWVLIENQLEKTDHTHLGQLITYAAGLQAATIIWIAESITEQHRAALDWLNEITGERFRFFGLEIELWKIGESKPAPKFNIVSKPNGWSKKVPKADGELGPVQKMRLDFWTAFQSFVQDNGKSVQFTPSTKPLLSVPFEFKSFDLFALFRPKMKRLGVGITCKGAQAKANFASLMTQRSAIESELGAELQWDENPDTTFCDIGLYRSVPEVNDETTWADCHDWLLTHLTKMRQSFDKRIRLLSLDESST